jgi:hypothetical protein
MGAIRSKHRRAYAEGDLSSIPANVIRLLDQESGEQIAGCQGCGDPLAKLMHEEEHRRKLFTAPLDDHELEDWVKDLEDSAFAPNKKGSVSNVVRDEEQD